MTTSAVGGAWSGQIRTESLSGVLGYGLVFVIGAALYVAVMLRIIFAPLRGLAAADRCAVIDAVRFGRPVGDPLLVEPLLVYTAKAVKRVRRGSIAVGAALLALLSGGSAIVAVRSFRVERIGQAVALTALAIGLALWAVVWPAVGRACRHNIEAARVASTTLARGLHPAGRLNDRLGTA